MRGAALATVHFAGTSPVVWVLVFLPAGQEDQSLRLRQENLIIVSPKLILPCLALGLSTFIDARRRESIISVCFNASLLKYGGDIAVGAMTILTSVMQFAMLPLQGLGAGRTADLQLQLRREKRCPRAKKPSLLLLKVQPDLFRLALGGASMLFPKAVCRESLRRTPSCIAFTAKALRIYCARTVHLRHSDRLPDDLRFHRQRALLNHRRHPA